MPNLTASRSAGVAVSADPDARRAGLLAVGEAASTVGRTRIRTVLLFACGSHAEATDEIAAGAAEHVPDAVVVVVGSVGVISNEGEAEGEPAVTALALTSSAAVATHGEMKTQEAAEAGGRALGEAISVDRVRPMMLFCRPTTHVGAFIDTFDRAAKAQVIVGGGISSEGRLAIREPGSEPRSIEGAIAVRIDGGMRLAVGVTPGIVRLSEFQTVDRIEDGFLLELGGETPLEVLTRALRGRTGRPLVLAVIAPEKEDGVREGECLVRGISGVDPTRGAVHLSSSIRVGQRIAFATPDAGAAKRDMASMLRDLSRGLCGGVPVAGIFLDCAGRGARLYGRHGVDGRAIRARLGDVPFAGLRSTFEIGPFDGRTRMHTYSGVLALLYAPS